MSFEKTTFNQLRELRLSAMADALRAQEGASGSLSFEERFAMLVDAEWLARKDRRISRLIRQAAFRFTAAVEDIEWSGKRGITRVDIQRLAAGDWIKKKRNLFLSGPTGVGKTYIASALGRVACFQNIPVKYFRLNDLFLSLSDAQAERRYLSFRKRVFEIPLLILDDWGLRKLTLEETQELMELFERRYDRFSTLICSQIPCQTWHELFPDPTLADAILDRLVHNALKHQIDGDSMRKVLAAKISDNSF